jgi:hypothetical protein
MLAVIGSAQPLYVRCDAFNALRSARAFFAFPGGCLNHQDREFVAA